MVTPPAPRPRPAPPRAVPAPPDRRPAGCPLSRTELLVLAAAAAGETSADAAARLCLSYETVRTARRRARARLGARTPEHAIALAVAAGWITAGSAR
ncbi:LuxR C-terminal-related transcriptional regulator [Streptomyces uncialis]|uniref:LuxR C-terminal-related transcriptional regulator n=1 Tax=Streptomyces uncialis TaxID=1048205 RepID=UPI0038661B63|nr:LuxR C-terminal-related transcriptional regulator [Streptomyces uncialis]